MFENEFQVSFEEDFKFKLIQFNGRMGCKNISSLIITWSKRNWFGHELQCVCKTFEILTPLIFLNLSNCESLTLVRWYFVIQIQVKWQILCKQSVTLIAIETSPSQITPLFIYVPLHRLLYYDVVQWAHSYSYVEQGFSICSFKSYVGLAVKGCAHEFRVCLSPLWGRVLMEGMLYIVSEICLCQMKVVLGRIHIFNSAEWTFYWQARLGNPWYHIIQVKSKVRTVHKKLFKAHQHHPWYYFHDAYLPTISRETVPFFKFSNSWKSGCSDFQKRLVLK